jgi:hypothetical protein
MNWSRAEIWSQASLRTTWGPKEAPSTVTISPNLCHAAAPDWAISAQLYHVTASYWSTSTMWDPNPYRPDRWALLECHVTTNQWSTSPSLCHMADHDRATSPCLCHMVGHDRTTSPSLYHMAQPWQCHITQPMPHGTTTQIHVSSESNPGDTWQHSCATWQPPIGPHHPCGPHIA